MKHEPAFPQHGWTKDPEVLDRMSKCAGMTLRDYFAAAAMQGFIAAPQDYTAVTSAQTCAEYAYEQADAMLAERDKKSS